MCGSIDEMSVSTEPSDPIFALCTSRAESQEAKNAEQASLKALLLQEENEGCAPLNIQAAALQKDPNARTARRRALVTTASGNTYLHFAAQSGRDDLIRVLAEVGGISVNQANFNGDTRKSSTGCQRV